MSAQLQLFTPADFVSYHARNPQIYEAFKRITLRAIAKGYNYWSAKGVFEIIRWETKVQADEEDFKINNNYTPFYARMFCMDFPSHKEFFRKRKSKFD